MKNSTRIFIYILYALAAGVFFLYLLFPSDLVKEILSEQLAQTQTEIEVDTDTIRPTIPPGLRFQPLLLSYAGTPFLNSEKVKIRPHLLSLMGDNKAFSFHGPLGSGRFSGRAEVAQTLKRVQQIIDIDITETPLEAIAYFKQWPQFTPSGLIDGQISYDSFKGGTGRVDADMIITPVRIVLNPPLMGIDVLDFTELQAEISATQRQLTIKKCEAFGTQINGKISGFISLRQPLGESRPTLSVTVKPQAAFIAKHKNDMIGGLLSSSKALKRGVVFQISGTLNNPSYVIR